NMPTVITFVSPAQRLSRAFNHVGQNSMKIFSSSGSVLCGHQQSVTSIALASVVILIVRQAVTGRCY
ncbi:hypothetical protein, partial [Burkholderia sp. BCC1640]|uniref:hypothetical protein n=1 Tax=Burkholderia sp. BCC1640 TaxID=2676294 RepID=UPI001ABB1CA6